MELRLPSPKKEQQYSDKEIIQGLKEGSPDRQHFENVFFKRYAGYIYKGTIEKCRNFKDAEALSKEVTQEAFIRIFKVIGNFAFPAKSPEADYEYIIKGWIGGFADKCFKKIYSKKIEETAVEVSTRSMDEVICPICGEFLEEEKKLFLCRNKHYKVKKEPIHGSPIPENELSYDLFESLYGDDSIIVTNEFRTLLQAAMNALTEREKHIILAYADEGCLSSKQHLSASSLADLCKAYNTTPDNIKHIKNRALKKMKAILFPK